MDKYRRFQSICLLRPAFDLTKYVLPAVPRGSTILKPSSIYCGYNLADLTPRIGKGSALRAHALCANTEALSAELGTQVRRG